MRFEVLSFIVCFFLKSIFGIKCPAGMGYSEYQNCCVTCPRNTYSPENDSKCYTCQCNNHANFIQSSCIVRNCDAGYGINQSGTNCVKCKNNFYSGDDDFHCKPCPKGQIPNKQKSACILIAEETPPEPEELSKNLESYARRLPPDIVYLIKGLKFERKTLRSRIYFEALDSIHETFFKHINFAKAIQQNLQFLGTLRTSSEDKLFNILSEFLGEAYWENMMIIYQSWYYRDLMPENLESLYEIYNQFYLILVSAENRKAIRMVMDAIGDFYFIIKDNPYEALDYKYFSFDLKVYHWAPEIIQKVGEETVKRFIEIVEQMPESPSETYQLGQYKYMVAPPPLTTNAYPLLNEEHRALIEESAEFFRKYPNFEQIVANLQNLIVSACRQSVRIPILATALKYCADELRNPQAVAGKQRNRRNKDTEN